MFFILSTSVSTLKKLICDKYRLLNHAFDDGGGKRVTQKKPKPSPLLFEDCLLNGLNEWNQDKPYIVLEEYKCIKQN